MASHSPPPGAGTLGKGLAAAARTKQAEKAATQPARTTPTRRCGKPSMEFSWSNDSGVATREYKACRPLENPGRANVAAISETVAFRPHSSMTFRHVQDKRVVLMY